MAQFILKITCADRPGIVAGVAQCIAEQGGNILESAQYSDETSGQFFMRVAFAPPEGLKIDAFRAAFAPVAARFAFDWQVHDTVGKMRAAIMVSMGGHCLNDLLYRTAAGRMPMEVTSVISNHSTWQRRVEHEGIAFHHLPITTDTKASQENELLRLAPGPAGTWRLPRRGCADRRVRRPARCVAEHRTQTLCESAS